MNKIKKLIMLAVIALTICINVNVDCAATSEWVVGPFTSGENNGDICGICNLYKDCYAIKYYREDPLPPVLPDGSSFQMGNYTQKYEWILYDKSGKILQTNIEKIICSNGISNTIVVRYHNRDEEVLDFEGNVLVKRGLYEWYQGFDNNGICSARKVGTSDFTYIDRNGNNLGSTYKGYLLESDYESEIAGYETVGYMQEGLVAVLDENGKVGFINTETEELAIPFLYDFDGEYPDIGYKGVVFGNGRCKIYLNGKYGVIDTKGNLVVPAVYDWVGDAYDGCIIVEKHINGEYKYGLIDLNGNIVVPIEYDMASGLLLQDGSYTVAIVNKENNQEILGIKKVKINDEKNNDVSINLTRFFQGDDAVYVTAEIANNNSEKASGYIGLIMGSEVFYTSYDLAPYQKNTIVIKTMNDIDNFKINGYGNFIFYKVKFTKNDIEDMKKDKNAYVLESDKEYYKNTGNDTGIVNFQSPKDVINYFNLK